MRISRHSAQGQKSEQIIMIKKILFITLSNFGDVILTLPVLDTLRTNYPDASITVMVGPRASEIFKSNPYIHNLIIYNKYARLREKTQLFFQLKKERFDIVIDLRNTLFGALLPARFRTSPFLYMPSRLRHMKERNLYRLRHALRYKRPLAGIKRKSIQISQADEKYIDALLQKNSIADSNKIIIVSPATGGRTRRWKKEKFTQLCSSLAKHYSVILIGRKSDQALTQYIQANCAGKVFDFAGLTNLAQLSFLLKRTSLVVVCDTGILHLASYLDIPIVGMFGPSDEQRYGPWSSRCKVITAAVPCRPCRNPDCKFKTVECMREISVNKVLDSISRLVK